MNWKLAWFSLAIVTAAIALWIGWGWSQNGRWAITERPRIVIDTRTGYLYRSVDRYSETTKQGIREAGLEYDSEQTKREMETQGER